MAGLITSIELQKRNPKRVNVYVDGAYAFAVTVEAATAAGLKPSLALSDEGIAALLTEDEQRKHYDAVLGFLSYRPRSTAEIRRYLAKRGAATQESDAILARLRDSGLIDDTAFARFWIENRAAFSPRGQRALRAELRSKGVDNEVIADSLDGDDDAAAYQAGLKRMRLLANSDYETFRRKLIPFLQRRGFAYETARLAMQRLWNERQSNT